MKEYPKMLYKAGGTTEIDSEKFTYVIVSDKSEESKLIKKGFSKTTVDALKKKNKPEVEEKKEVSLLKDE